MCYFCNFIGQSANAILLQTVRIPTQAWHSENLSIENNIWARIEEYFELFQMSILITKYTLILSQKEFLLNDHGAYFDHSNANSKDTDIKTDAQTETECNDWFQLFLV